MSAFVPRYSINAYLTYGVIGSIETNSLARVVRLRSTIFPSITDG